MFTMLALLVSVGMRGQYNPPNPPEPTFYHSLTLIADPAGGGYFNMSSPSMIADGSSVTVTAMTNSGFIFVCWEMDGETVSTSASYKFVMPSKNMTLTAHFEYNPGSPSEPSEPRLRHKLFLESNPSSGGYFNVTSGSEYEEGASVFLRAYSNSWYVFQNWTMGDSVISTNTSFTYTMPKQNVTLTAHYIYNYNPSNPSEPSQPTGDNVSLYGLTQSGLPEQEVLFPIYLENRKTVYGLEVDMQFPEGFTVSAEGIALSDRANGHKLTAKTLGGNRYHLALTGANAFTGDNGKLLDVPVTIPATVEEGGSYPVVLASALAVDKNGTKDSITVRSGSITIDRHLPDLHIYNLDCSEPVAGKKLTVTWTVKNDGSVPTGDAVWQDYIWIVPDVYLGTAGEGSRLMATVDRVKALQPGESYSNSADVTIDSHIYGNYYLLVATDMYTVTNIDWSAVGGMIVNPYQPTQEGTGYRHLYASTSAAYNKIMEKDETASYSDNFFYKKLEIDAPLLDDEDWKILKAAYRELGQGEGWVRKWVFTEGANSLVGLPGVEVSDGHVVGISLPDNQMTGPFPFALLKLPSLQALDLHGNDLTGDLAEDLEAYMISNELPVLVLKSLDVSYNHLHGNIGTFVQQFPALNSFNASYNAFEKVSPMIPTTVVDLNIGHQEIDEVIPFHLSNLSPDGLYDMIPNILTYDHQKRGYVRDFDMLCSTLADDWSVQLSCHDEEVSMPYVSEQYAYHGLNGDTLKVEMVDKERLATGSTFRIALCFAMGDSNFDGEVDVTDLQATINEIMEKHDTHGRTPFNFTAANINHDEDLNVLDVIGEVNILMDANPAAMPHAYRTEANVAPTHDAMVYVADGQLCIHSEVPVAAFDIRVSNADLKSLSPTLAQARLTCTVKEQGDGFHIIGYSLSGGLLPVGETSIATLSGASATAATAVLANEHAAKIATTCNMSPTGISIIARQHIDIRPSGQGFAITSPEDGIAAWRVTTTDGRLIGQGELPVRTSSASHIALPSHGMFIVTVQTAQESVTQKVINIR